MRNIAAALRYWGDSGVQRHPLLGLRAMPESRCRRQWHTVQEAAVDAVTDAEHKHRCVAGERRRRLFGVKKKTVKHCLKNERTKETRGAVLKAFAAGLASFVL